MSLTKNKQLIRNLGIAISYLPSDTLVQEAIDELKEMERLAEIGKATEKALKIQGSFFYIPGAKKDAQNIEEFLDWHREEVEWMRIKDIPIKDEDLIIGVDYTQGKDLTCISMYMTVEKYKELERLAEIGRATKKAFEEGVFLTYALFSYEGEILEYEIQEDVEDLLEWYRGRQTNDW